ncbi:ATP-binding protein [Paraflavitalea sp. CAU 1676]|uniref:sensor histidine kinase n=1 Tax=Paraflavitalea sp. CAU 1676 TaxID=3032598 RepID=UPI0023DB7329|nr:ATP-binding protein [Paraflavitalea sp. CAU 1676]MDF2193609.1 ATP-binding protein [Paraflavitalea sp. CAU 1676]
MNNQGQELYVMLLISSVLAIAVVTFIVIVVLQYQRRQHRHEKELTRMKDQYEQEVLRSQLEMQEETFKMIGEELHDNIGQVLSVVKLSLAILPIEKDHPAFESILNSRQILNQAAIDLSNLTKSMHTDRIAKVGLVEAIGFEMESIRKSGLMNVRFEAEGVEDHFFAGEKAIFLFRMFQEMLNNILKHSQGTQVNLNLSFSQDNKFTLVLADNGVGFDVEAKRNSVSSSSGVGLKSIFNRAKLIGANLDMKSMPGKGTTVTIQLSLPQES